MHRIGRGKQREVLMQLIELRGLILIASGKLRHLIPQAAVVVPQVYREHQ